MTKRNLSAVAALAILLAACIPSVNPFYTDKDVVVDAHLIGEWQDKGKTNEPEVWTFVQTTNSDYALTVSEGGKSGEFSAHLFQLQQERFLDLIPTDCNFATNQAYLVALSMFPGHLLMRVAQIEPELKIAPCDYNWLQKYLEKNPGAISHHVESGSILLTAETADLQQFILKHLGTNELFSDYSEMKRTK